MLQDSYEQGLDLPGSIAPIGHLLLGASDLSTPFAYPGLGR
jgi:hypothetical protein